MTTGHFEKMECSLYHCMEGILFSGMLSAQLYGGVFYFPECFVYHCCVEGALFLEMSHHFFKLK
jgi:hypothetical protein